MIINSTNTKTFTSTNFKGKNPEKLTLEIIKKKQILSLMKQINDSIAKGCSIIRNLKTEEYNLLNKKVDSLVQKQQCILSQKEEEIHQIEKNIEILIRQNINPERKQKKISIEKQKKEQLLQEIEELKTKFKEIIRFQARVREESEKQSLKRHNTPYYAIPEFQTDIVTVQELNDLINRAQKRLKTERMPDTKEFNELEQAIIDKMEELDRIKFASIDKFEDYKLTKKDITQINSNIAIYSEQKNKKTNSFDEILEKFNATESLKYYQKEIQRKESYNHRTLIFRKELRTISNVEYEIVKTKLDSSIDASLKDDLITYLVQIKNEMK